MNKYCSTPELAALIEWQASTDGDLTDLYRDLPGPDFLMAATTNPNDKVEVRGLLDVRIDLS